MSIVRDNLMRVPGYAPYCASDRHTALVRTRFDGAQFVCSCGWRSSFPEGFIRSYRERWGLADPAKAET